jgi:hypothetical protein
VNDDDLKIRQLFDEINTPKYDILEGVKNSMDKKYKKPRFGVAAAVAALLVILTAGVVVAAYYGTGGFGRLRDIVGDEYAQGLTPVEEILGAPHDGFATPFIPGHSPTHDDLRIEIVAINIEEDYLYLYATLEDLTGDRANCEFNGLSFGLHTPDNAHLYDFSADWNGLFGNFREVIHRDENGTLTLRTRHRLHGRTDVFVDDSVTITFTELTFNSTGYIDHQINLDLTAVSADAPYLSVMFEGSAEPLYILEPFHANIPIGLPGIRAKISSVGLIGGNLHVQIYQPRPSYSAFSTLFLSSPQDRTRPSRAFIFNLREDGILYNDSFAREAKHPTNSGYFARNDFQEFIWFDFDPESLDSLYLSGIFYDNDSIWLDWTTTFAVLN